MVTQYTEMYAALWGINYPMTSNYHELVMSFIWFQVSTILNAGLVHFGKPLLQMILFQLFYQLTKIQR